MSDSIDSAVARLVAGGVASKASLEGCSEAEIVEVENSHGGKLPGVYRRFLAIMGRSAGQFLIGTDFLFPDVLTLRGQAERLLQDCGVGVALDSSDFVFALHQGYQFLFVKCGQSDDPEVWLFLEGEADFRRVAGSFSEWIGRCVDDEIIAASEVNG